MNRYEISQQERWKTHLITEIQNAENYYSPNTQSMHFFFVSLSQHPIPLRMCLHISFETSTHAHARTLQTHDRSPDTLKQLF
jgi:hypothetical protein